MPAQVICSQWFLCIFSNRLPCETVCRIWDAVFCRGPQAMFQIALAMMKTNESKIAACDEIGGVMEVCHTFASVALWLPLCEAPHATVDGWFASS